MWANQNKKNDEYLYRSKTILQKLYQEHPVRFSFACDYKIESNEKRKIKYYQETLGSYG